MSARTLPGRQLRGAIYLRISDDREGRELGVQRQEKDLRALFARLGIDVVAVYSDNDIGASTRSRKPRPGYKRLLNDAAGGAFDVIGAYTSGRLTRRPRENEDLIELAEKSGIQYRYVASPSFDLNTAAGRRIARILAANDAGESEDIGERVIAARTQARAAGKWLGGMRPFGYDRGGMIIREVESQAVRDAVRDVLAGASLRSIADMWTRTAPPTSWTERTVNRLLDRDPATLSDVEAALYQEAVGCVADKETPAEIAVKWVDRPVPIPGARWDGSGVRRVLINPRNAGLMKAATTTDRRPVDPNNVIRAAWGRVITDDGQWGSIITEDQWRAVRALCADRIKNS